MKETIIEALKQRFLNSDIDVTFDKDTRANWVYINGNKTKIRWTPELEQDLATYNEPKEAELILVDIILQEIDNNEFEEILIQKFKQKYPSKTLKVEPRGNFIDFKIWNYIFVDDIEMKAGWAPKSLQDLSIMSHALDVREELSNILIQELEFQMNNDSRFK